MKIVVVHGNLDEAIKRWQVIATQNRTMARSRTFAMGPSAKRKLKARLARKRRGRLR